MGRLSLPFLLGVALLALFVLGIRLAREPSHQEREATVRTGPPPKGRGVREIALSLAGIGIGLGALALLIEKLG